MSDQPTAGERWAGISTELANFRSGLDGLVAALATSEAVATSESGNVVARCAAGGDLRALEIDEQFFADASTRTLEREIATAVRAAEQASRDAATEHLSKLTMFGVPLAAGLTGGPIGELLPFPQSVRSPDPSNRGES